MQYCRIISLDNNNSVKIYKFKGDNSTTNDSMVMKIAHAKLHMYTNTMYKFQQYVQNCRRKASNNKKSVKFTSSRGDNSTTNDSMVMKIAHAQIRMYRNIMYKFQSSTCKTAGEKFRTKLCPRTGGQTDERTVTVILVYPLQFVVGGYKNRS